MNRYLYTKVYSIIIHNSQKLETTQASTDRWMDKENVHNGILFNLKKRKFYSAQQQGWIFQHYA